MVLLLVALSAWRIAAPDAIRAQTTPSEPALAWGVQLAGAFSEAEARSQYERARGMLPVSIPVGPPVVERTSYASRGSAPFFRARIDVPSRSEAVNLCNRIQEAGGSCVVLRVPPRL
jgi:hypothetical protein